MTVDTLGVKKHRIRFLRTDEAVLIIGIPLLRHGRGEG